MAIPAKFNHINTGTDTGFQVRGGGGGAHLKKLRRAERGANIFEIFHVKKSRFYAKKSYFFQLRREARKFLRYFVRKSTILRQKNYFFPILGGTRRPLDSPLKYTLYRVHFTFVLLLNF